MVAMDARMRALIFVFTLFLVPHSAGAAEMQCIDCHPDKREGKVIHAALDMGCGSCHAGNHAGEKPAPTLMAPAPDLCFNCHDKRNFTKKVQHSAVAGGMCTSCHNPHSSKNAKLLTALTPDLCFTCHDKSMFTKKTVHPPVKDGQCTYCHSPHASDHPGVLNQPLADLCTTCHDRQTSGRHVMAAFSASDTHPVKGKPDPSRSGRELSCTSCHNPHASEQKKLLTNEAKSPGNLCLLCHKKIMAKP
jgi:predicted CXXCH cytochrome family protein